MSRKYVDADISKVLKCKIPILLIMANARYYALPKPANVFECTVYSFLYYIFIHSF